MKFVLCHICSLLTALGCLAVLSGSTALADEKEKKEVVVETEVVVSDGAEGEAIAEAIQKAIQEKLKGLPDDLRKKIEAKVTAETAKKKAGVTAKRLIQLKAAPHGDHEHDGDHDAHHSVQLHVDAAKGAIEKAGGEIKIQAKAIIIGDDGETKVIELDGEDISTMLPKALAGAKKALTYKVMADKVPAGKDADGQNTFVFRVEGDDASEKKVMMFGDSPHAHGARTIHIDKGDGDAKQIRVVVVNAGDEKSAKDGEQTITVQIDGDKILLNGKPLKTDVLKNVPEGMKKRIQVRVQKDDEEKPETKEARRVIFMSKDGDAKEIDIELLKKEGNVWFGKAQEMQQHQQDIAKKHAELAQKHAQMVKDLTVKHAAMAKKVQESHAMGAQLKAIQAELVKIRKLLEDMQDDDETMTATTTSRRSRTRIVSQATHSLRRVPVKRAVACTRS